MGGNEGEMNKRKNLGSAYKWAEPECGLGGAYKHRKLQSEGVGGRGTGEVRM